MALRGRGASKMPEELAGKMAGIAGIPLGAEASKAENRKSGIGALLGYGQGLGLGAIYGLVRPFLGRGGPFLAGIALGATAMAASDIPATASGATDPRKWGAAGWLADIVPHLAYGLATALAFEAFTSWQGGAELAAGDARRKARRAARRPWSRVRRAFVSLLRQAGD